MTRFGFVKVPTQDLVRQQAFYEAALGFERYAEFESDDLEEVLMRQAEDGFVLALMRIKAGAPAASATIGTLGFITDDIEAALARALDAGAAPKRGVFDVPGTRLALASDPEGNEIEFIQFL